MQKRFAKAVAVLGVFGLLFLLVLSIQTPAFKKGDMVDWDPKVPAPTHAHKELGPGPFTIENVYHHLEDDSRLWQQGRDRRQAYELTLRDKSGSLHEPVNGGWFIQK
jgi:hypothetical protein